MNNRELTKKEGSNVLVINVNDTHFLRVFKALDGSVPNDATDFPQGISENIESFSILTNTILDTEFKFHSNDQDGIYDNFGNIYAPIIDFQ